MTVKPFIPLFLLIVYENLDNIAILNHRFTKLSVKFLTVLQFLLIIRQTVDSVV